MYKGIQKNQNYTWLICAAQNMKNIAIKKEKVSGESLTNASIYEIITEFKEKIQFLLFKKCI